MGNPGFKARRLAGVRLFAALVLVLAGCRGTGGASEGPASIPSRVADAIAVVDSVRVEMWVSQRSVALGHPLTATGRVTNLSSSAIWYEGRPCAQLLVGLVRFPDFDVFGRRPTGVAGRVKNDWAQRATRGRDRYSEPASNGFFGTRNSSCNHDQEQDPPLSHLGPGKSLALTVSGAPEWDQGAFPAGPGTLGVIFSFSRSEHSNATDDRDAYASVPVTVRGGTPTISPGAALDAAFVADGVPAYLMAHANATQLTADPRLSATQWMVNIQAIDASPTHKTVSPTLLIAIGRASGRVLSVTASR